VRSKLIITGAIGVLAAATLAVNAENAASKTTGGSVGTLLAATAQVVKVDRDEIAIAARATATAAAAQSAKPEASEPAKSEDTDKPAAPTVTLPTACQGAITNLKTLHQADIAEDASERTGLEPASATALAADRNEDALEAQKLMSAVMVARAACGPEPATACRTAITGLQAALLSWRTVELAEAPGAETDWATDFAPIRTAFSGIAAACADRV
jgi:hypothetical protein